MTHRGPTITDVARHAGVSKGLVSLALNRRPGVATETRERILASVDALGWTPSASARGLSLRSTFALGMVLRRSADVLAERGWTLMLSVTPDAETEERAYRELGGQRADGFFLSDLRVDDPRLALLTERQLPAVTLGRPLSPSPFPSVGQDDRDGVRSAVDHLVGLGHSAIAYVAGDQTLVHGVRRREAFAAAMAAAGLAADQVVPGDFSAASGARAVTGLLAADGGGPGRRPTAVVFGSDPMAIAGLGALQAAGIAVPQQMSVIGFDGNELGGYLHPPLTTVITDPLHWGAEAARVLLELIGAPDADPRSLDRDLAPARLLLRASTAPPPT